ncbi:MAG: hypothetical protein J7M25_10640 [Deltaproteobacteria bacterium]|nr:hypothetical protein [Deltaproteobacteria bacterium]
MQRIIWTSIALVTFIWSFDAQAAASRRSSCKAGWHHSAPNTCVRDTCPLGWTRGADLACHLRTCPRGFVKQGKLCLAKRCPRGSRRDARKRCTLVRSWKCGPGRFLNPAGRCMRLPRISAYGIMNGRTGRRTLLRQRKGAKRVLPVRRTHARIAGRRHRRASMNRKRKASANHRRRHAKGRIHARRTLLAERPNR